MPNRLTSVGIAATVILLALAGAAYWFGANPGVAGFFYDDGIYLMAAKALATGHGYTLAGMLDQPAIVKYPPLFPALLAPIWWLLPAFPGNIMAFKAVNIALSLLAVAATGALAHRRNLPGWAVFGVMALLATHLQWVRVATELMSEPLYLLLTMLVLLVADAGANRAAETKPLSWRWVLLLIVLSVAMVYTRTLGVLMIAAVMLDLGLRGRSRLAAGYAMACGVLLLPWVWHSATHSHPAQAMGAFLLRSFQAPYTQSLAMDLQHEYTPLSLLGSGLSALVEQFPVAMIPGTAGLPAVGLALLGAVMLMGGAALGIRAVRAQRISTMGLYVTLYLLALPLWSFHDHYLRFLIVIVPLVWMLALTAIPLRRRLGIGMGLLLTVAVAAQVMQVVPLILQKPHPNTLAVNTQADVWADYTDIFRRIRTLAQPGDRLWSDNHDEAFLFALYTGQPTADFFLFLPDARIPTAARTLDGVQMLFQQKATVLYRVLTQKNIRYVVAHTAMIAKTPNQPQHLMAKRDPSTRMMIEAAPERFVLRAVSPHRLMALYEVLPETPPPR